MSAAAKTTSEGSIRGAKCLSDLALDRLLDGNMREGEAGHAATCEACGKRLEALRTDREQWRERARPKAFIDGVVAKGKRRRWAMIGWAAPSVVAAMAAVVVVVGQLTHSPAQPQAEDAVRVKGGDLVEVYLQSGGKTQKFDDGGKVRAGDALQLVYTIGRPRFLTVVDAEPGRAEVIYRSGRALPAGRRELLERSFVLDGGGRTERLYLVWSDGAADERRLIDTAMRADLEKDRGLSGMAQESVLLHR